LKISRNQGILYAAVCSLLWSSAGVLIKLLPWNSLVIAGLRSGLAMLVLWGALWLAGSPRPVLTRHTLLTGVMLGSCTTLFVSANKLTTAANAIVLQSANPIFVLLFGALIFRQRFLRRDLAAVILCCTGIALFLSIHSRPAGLSETFWRCSAPSCWRERFCLRQMRPRSPRPQAASFWGIASPR
jgi:drug/metabolite transporter (DMT)-like permease